MAHLPDERFKQTINDLEDCLDAIQDGEVEKPSEKKKAVKLFALFLECCMDMNIISSYTLDPLRHKLDVDDSGTTSNVYREQKSRTATEVEYTEEEESEDSK